MSVLSHELRTPLTPLRVYLEVLLAGKAGPLTTQHPHQRRVGAGHGGGVGDRFGDRHPRRGGGEDIRALLSGGQGRAGAV
jgi:signal transduction histidine kinase